MHENRIVAFAGVQLDELFGSRQADAATRAPDAIFGGHKSVCAFGAKDTHGVVASAAHDFNRAVCLIAVDFGLCSGTQQRMDGKTVIGIATFKAQQRIVGIDVKRIRTSPATDQRVVADAVRNPATRGFSCGYAIGATAERAADRRGRPKDLPDQEGVIPLAAIQHHDGAVVI